MTQAHEVSLHLPGGLTRGRTEIGNHTYFFLFCQIRRDVPVASQNGLQKRRECVSCTLVQQGGSRDSRSIE